MLNEAWQPPANVSYDVIEVFGGVLALARQSPVEPGQGQVPVDLLLHQFPQPVVLHPADAAAKECLIHDLEDKWPCHSPAVMYCNV